MTKQKPTGPAEPEPRRVLKLDATARMVAEKRIAGGPRRRDRNDNDEPFDVDMERLLRVVAPMRRRR